METYVQTDIQIDRQSDIHSRKAVGHADRQTDKHMPIQTEREADRQTCRQIDIHSTRQIDRQADIWTYRDR